MSSRSGHRARTTLCSLLVVCLLAVLGSASSGHADPLGDQQQQIEQIAATLVRLNQRIESLSEDHGAAQQRKAELDVEIEATAKQVATEQAQYDALQSTLTDLAVNRFVGNNNAGLSPLFSSGSAFSEAQQRDALTSVAVDASAATADDVQSVVRTLNASTERLQRAQAEATALIATIAAKQAEGEQLIAEYTQRAAEAKAKYGELVQQEADRQAALAAEQAAAAAAAAPAPTAVSRPVTLRPRGGGGTTRTPTTPADEPPATTSPAQPADPGTPSSPTPTPPVTTPTPDPTPAPPAVSGRAGIAIAAARSVLGVPYVAFQASPSRGFDCSGLTMWAWAQAGVSLPHYSKAQYASNPHVAKNDAQPGDLVFFYSPISHVGLYVGGGMMIDAPHTGATVRLVPVRWNRVVGVARPG
jgi:cell wall-associated NlpC family hydrolase